MAASATLALKAGVWFRRGRRGMVSPDSRATACPPSGRNSTYRPVQISGTSSERVRLSRAAAVAGPIDYLLRRWDRFARFAEDGRICLSNNAAERALRGFAI